MKTLALSACLAVASPAAAADLKDPSEVAHNWAETIEQARGPLLADGPLGLSAGEPAPLLGFKPATPARPPRVRRNGDVMEVPRGWQIDPKMLYDAPNPTPPPGAKPWYYRGQKFWLIPLASPSGK